MDKLLEIVMAAVVISVTGLAVLFALNGQSGSFSQVLGNQSDSAQCDLHWQNYKNKVQCEPSVLEQNGASDLRMEYSSECDQYGWTAYDACGTSP